MSQAPELPNYLAQSSNISELGKKTITAELFNSYFPKLTYNYEKAVDFDVKLSGSLVCRAQLIS